MKSKKDKENEKLSIVMGTLVLIGIIFLTLLGGLMNLLVVKQFT